jgi:hypothetical protein
MKNTIKALVIIFAFFATPSFAASQPTEPVKVISTRRYVFQYKVEKEIIGGTVEILDANQTLVRTER